MSALCLSIDVVAELQVSSIDIVSDIASPPNNSLKDSQLPLFDMQRTTAVIELSVLDWKLLVCRCKMAGRIGSPVC